MGLEECSGLIKDVGMLYQRRDGDLYHDYKEWVNFYGCNMSAADNGYVKIGCDIGETSVNVFIPRKANESKDTGVIIRIESGEFILQKKSDHGSILFGRDAKKFHRFYNGSKRGPSAEVYFKIVDGKKLLDKINIPFACINDRYFVKSLISHLLEGRVAEA